MLRSYALGDEAALLMASYPKERPETPFPYFTEVMTGFEHTAAIGMLYEGQETAGLRHMTDIRDRYDGRERNPFDEAECGHHYARAMIAWAAHIAWTGFHYYASEQPLRLAARPGQWFVSTGDAWGTAILRHRGGAMDLCLHVPGGAISVRSLCCKTGGRYGFPGLVCSRGGSKGDVAVSPARTEGALRWDPDTDDPRRHLGSSRG